MCHWEIIVMATQWLTIVFGLSSFSRVVAWATVLSCRHWVTESLELLPLWDRESLELPPLSDRESWACATEWRRVLSCCHCETEKESWACATEWQRVLSCCHCETEKESWACATEWQRVLSCCHCETERVLSCLHWETERVLSCRHWVTESLELLPLRDRERALSCCHWVIEREENIHCLKTTSHLPQVLLDGGWLVVALLWVLANVFFSRSQIILWWTW